ncbi:putative ankyrin repeat protein L25 [Colletotrichum siamense]|nr:putative ankyrin repeat protein L25 [Colletotrichum siamense]
MDDMRRWLSPADPSSNLEAARAQRHAGTGVWFLESDLFVRWKTGEIRFLWLYGIVGAGKTVLSTTVFSHLEDVGSRCTLAFFFDSMDIGKQTFDCLLRSLAWQLYRSVAASRGELESLYKLCSDGATQPDISRLSVCIESMMQSSEGLSVIIDALDECTTMQALLAWLETIVSNSSFNNVNFIVTGRQLIDLMRFTRSICSDECFVSMIQPGARDDIESYVEARLKQDMRFTIPQDSLGEIRTRLVNECGGMFLWTAIQLDALAACQSLAAMKASLQSLPRDLLETYRGIIRRLNPDYRNDVIRLLQFLTYTEQPLTTSAAIEIMATRLDTDPPHFNVENRLFRDEDLLQHCPSLLSLIAPSPDRRESRKVRLSHSTVKDFLLREGDQFERKSASIAITRTALIYIRDIDSEITLEDALARFPLAERAATMLLEFARHAEADDGVLSEIMSFLLDSFALDEGNGTDVSALCVASQEGHSEVIRLLLEHGADVSAGDDASWSPLHAASKNGHHDIVQALINRGADVNAHIERRNHPITLASSRGHVKIVQLLISVGTEVNGFALYEASSNGHVEVVKALLEKKPRLIDLGPFLQNPALYIALEKGHDRVVEVLRSYILCRAARAGDYYAVKELLDEGASPNGRTSLGTPLNIAAKCSHTPIVKLLLERGADAIIAVGDDRLAYDEDYLWRETSEEILDLLREHQSGGLSSDKLNDGLDD